MADKGRENRQEILDKKRTNLVSRITRKSRKIDILLYSHQNHVTANKEIAQLSDKFKLIEAINQEIIELDDNYTEELWLTDINQKLFSFKHKFHNWLREGDEIQITEKSHFYHVSDLRAPSHHPDHQVPNHRGYLLKREPSKSRYDL